MRPTQRRTQGVSQMDGLWMLATCLLKQSLVASFKAVQETLPAREVESEGKTRKAGARSCPISQHTFLCLPTYVYLRHLGTYLTCIHITHFTKGALPLPRAPLSSPLSPSHLKNKTILYCCCWLLYATRILQSTRTLNPPVLLISADAPSANLSALTAAIERWTTAAWKSTLLCPTTWLAMLQLASLPAVMEAALPAAARTLPCPSPRSPTADSSLF